MKEKKGTKSVISRILYYSTITKKEETKEVDTGKGDVPEVQVIEIEDREPEIKEEERERQDKEDEKKIEKLEINLPKAEVKNEGNNFSDKLDLWEYWKKINE